MRDTVQRSVAEIIGWRWDEDGGYWHVNDKTWASHETSPTVDDMLAWLRAQGYQFYARTKAITDAGLYVGVSKPGGAPMVSERLPWRSLHEALEAAVRKVAEATT